VGVTAGGVGVVGGVFGSLGVDSAVAEGEEGGGLMGRGRESVGQMLIQASELEQRSDLDRSTWQSLGQLPTKTTSLVTLTLPYPIYCPQHSNPTQPPAPPSPPSLSPSNTH
jgi:hypothetical protein